MRMRLKVILPIIGLTAGLASCGKSSAPPTQPTPSGQTQTESKATITIPLGDPYYGAGAASSSSPWNVTIAAGGTVTWSNKDAQVHNVTSDTGSWTPQDINASGDFTRVFATKGTFAFHCAIHAGMTGMITVQ
jgi:plastocyanin